MGRWSDAFERLQAAREAGVSVEEVERRAAEELDALLDEED